VQGSGSRIQDSDVRVQSSGFRVQGSGFRVSVETSLASNHAHRVTSSCLYRVTSLTAPPLGPSQGPGHSPTARSEGALFLMSEVPPYMSRSWLATQQARPGPMHYWQASSASEGDRAIISLRLLHGS